MVPRHLLAGAALLAALPVAARAAPSFAAAPCPAALARYGLQTRCGSVSVPENRQKLDSRTIQLTVYIFQPPGGATDPTPVLFLHGGPGVGVLDTLVSGEINPEGAAGFAQSIGRRAWVFYDQRGAGRSRPALRCGLTEPEAACVRRILASGADPAGYTTAENVADVDALRQALGATQIYLYGASYGTRLALETDRAYPGMVKALALDGVEADQFAANAPSVRTENTQALALLRACAADQACAAAFPRVLHTAQTAIRTLNETPVLTNGVPTSGDDLLGTLFTAQYAPQNFKYFPMVYQRALKGDLAPLARLVSPNEAATLRAFSIGVTRLVECSEESSEAYVPALQAQIANGAPMLAGFARSALQAIAACRVWPAVRAGRPKPRRRTTPALIISGEFDPTTPPSYGALAARRLPNSQQITFAAFGHVARSQTFCPAAIATGFFDGKRGAALDTACARLPHPIPWETALPPG